MISPDPKLTRPPSDQVSPAWMQTFYERFYSLWRALAKELGDRGSFNSDQSYTPTWSGTGSPALGNGMLAGSYEVRGKFCRISIQLVAGTTTTFGTGTWLFSLPFPAARMSTGTAECIHTGVSVAIGVSAAASGGTVLAVATNSGNVSATVPFTWASTDQLNIDLEYRI